MGCNVYSIILFDLCTDRHGVCLSDFIAYCKSRGEHHGEWGSHLSSIRFRTLYGS